MLLTVWEDTDIQFSIQLNGKKLSTPQFNLSHVKNIWCVVGELQVFGSGNGCSTQNLSTVVMWLIHNNSNGS